MVLVFYHQVQSGHTRTRIIILFRNGQWTLVFIQNNASTYTYFFV